MELTREGLYRDRLNEIKFSLDAIFTNVFGPVNTEPDSFIGQYIGILTEVLDDIQEQIQDVYDSMYPFSAEGVSLDGAVALVGIYRLPASATAGWCMCYGNEGVVIPAGSIVHDTANKSYASQVDVVITRARAGDVSIQIRTPTIGQMYSIYIYGVQYSFTSVLGTAQEIIQGLRSSMRPLEENFVFEIVDNTLRMYRSNGYSPFQFTCTTNISISRIATPVYFVALEKGNYPAPANSIINIDTAISGWAEINNLIPAVTGRFEETDEELRLRHLQGTRVVGSATVKAIRARIIQEVANVSSCRVYENRKGYEVDGMPSHSIECIVEGGDEQLIANKIWEVKPAGIETWGNITLFVYDENNEWQEISFSRAERGYAWVKVDVVRLNSEEVLSENIEDVIADAIVSYGNSLEIGEDIIAQRFVGPVFNNTTGLARIIVSTFVTDDEDYIPVDSDYSLDDIIVNRRQIYSFSVERVVVAGV